MTAYLLLRRRDAAYHRTVMSHKKMKRTLIHIMILLLIGCQGESEICGELDDVHYVVNHYYTNMDKVNHIEYYNSKDQLLRWWRPAEEIKNYKYDNKGKLIEVQYSRSCRSVLEHKYQLYNDEGQHIGEHISQTPITNLDSVEQIQTKFYNNLGQLERELIKEKGKPLNKQYSYENGKLTTTIVLNENNEQIRIERNFFGISNLIDSTKVQSNGITWTEINKYDLNKRLKSKTISSNTKPEISNSNYDKSKVIFDNYNHVRNYEYKDKGNIMIERRIGNNGKSNLTIIQEKKYAT